MSDFTVHAYGTDTSGRTIYMTAYQHAWLEDVTAELDFVPTIVQGAFMVRNGGGAADSAGYHDAAGCLDFRTWDLTADEAETLVRTLRRHGAAAWRRDHEHGGMDPHCHIVLGTDVPLAPGATQQWRDYVQGFDGLASRGPDYEYRPNPLVLTPPEVDDMPAPKDWDAEDWAAFDAHVWGAEIGKDRTRAGQVLNKLKTWLERQKAS